MKRRISRSRAGSSLAPPNSSVISSRESSMTGIVAVAGSGRKPAALAQLIGRLAADAVAVLAGAAEQPTGVLQVAVHALAVRVHVTEAVAGERLAAIAGAAEQACG